MRTLFAVFLCAIGAFAGPAELKRAEELYRLTRYQEALRLLQPGLSTNAAEFRVAGMAAYGMGDYKRATEMFAKAVQLEPGRGANYLWLGRAFGRRAETSNPLIAPRYATKTRQNFEKAVELDPKNGEAINDLFSYYLEAPGFLGGGYDKAQGLLPKIKALDEAEHEYAQAQLSESKKEFHSAEEHLKRAAEIAPKSVGRVIDVARFFARRGRFQESYAWLKRAEKIAPKDPKVLFNTAQTYIEAKQNLFEAKAMLKLYLQTPLNPDLPSREEAEKLLRQAGGE